MSNPEGHPRKRLSLAATLKALVRARLTAGLLLVLPIWITILLIRFLFTLMRDASAWVILGLMQSTTVADWVRAIGFVDYQPLATELRELPVGVQIGVSIFSVVLTFTLLYTIGLLAANIVGRRLIHSLESVVDRVPFVKTVYRSSKQILETFAGDQTQNFQRVALIPFPHERMRCVGFITAVFHDSVTQEELATVFIPTTPNPTTGYLQILRRADLTEVDWNVEDAVRTIMSGGIIRPEFLTIQQGQFTGPGTPVIAAPSVPGSTAPTGSTPSSPS